MSTPRLKLVDVESDADIEAVRTMMADRVVWRNLALDGQPGPGKFRGFFLMGRYQAHFIVDETAERRIGFVLLNCGKLKSRGEVEVDIAITDVDYKGKGLSKIALGMTFDAWLLTDRARRCTGWIDVKNLASIGMVEALNVPVTGYGEQDGEFVDGLADTVNLAIDKPTWLALKDKLSV